MTVQFNARFPSFCHSSFVILNEVIPIAIGTTYNYPIKEQRQVSRQRQIKENRRHGTDSEIAALGDHLPVSRLFFHLAPLDLHL